MVAASRLSRICFPPFARTGTPLLHAVTLHTTTMESANPRTRSIFIELILQGRLVLEGIQHLLQVDNWITRQRGYRDGTLCGVVMVGRVREMRKVGGVVPAP